jgi:hypothetical protein
MSFWTASILGLRTITAHTMHRMDRQATWEHRWSRCTCARQKVWRTSRCLCIHLRLQHQSIQLLR